MLCDATWNFAIDTWWLQSHKKQAVAKNCARILERWSKANVHVRELDAMKSEYVNGGHISVLNPKLGAFFAIG